MTGVSGIGDPIGSDTALPAGEKEEAGLAIAAAAAADNYRLALLSSHRGWFSYFYYRD
jgi:hypothetical protein